MHLHEQVTQPSDPSYRLIPLTHGYVCKVDAADYKWLMQWKWHTFRRETSTSLYVEATLKIRGQWQTFLMHRFITKCPVGMQVDHIDGDGLNNCRSNLRICTQAENCKNRAKPKSNTTGFKGVYFRRLSNKWIAKITVNKKQVQVGTFLTPEEAHAAYCKAAQEHHGKFAHF